MTAQEERFESFVNGEQAFHDILVEHEEWLRCKAVEEEAVKVYDRLNGDMHEYVRRMATIDQHEVEFQCTRKKNKELLLQQLWGMEQQRMQLEEATASAQSAAREDSRARATSPLIAETESVPAATVSQQARQQEPPVSNQTGPSTQPSSSSQQVQKKTRSDGEVRREFKTAVEARARAQSNDNQAPSSSGAGPATQRDQTTARSQEVTPAQSHRRVQPASRNSQPTKFLAAEEENEFRPRFLTTHPSIGESRARATTRPSFLTNTEILEQAARIERAARAARAARTTPFRAPDRRPRSPSVPRSPRVVWTGDRFVEIKNPAAGPSDQGGIDNAPGGGDQQVGSNEQPPTNSSSSSSSRRSSSEEASSTPPSSQPSPENLSPDKELPRPLDSTPNDNNSDLEWFEGHIRRVHRLDPALDALLMARLERVINREGDRQYAAHHRGQGGDASYF